MARTPQHVRKIETPRGPRYETRVNVTARDGSRVQMRRRFQSAAAAADWHRRTSMALADGAFVARSSLTVKQACEAWLRAKELRTKPTTAAAYTAALAPVIERYGRMPVQSVTRADVETLIAELAANAARQSERQIELPDPVSVTTAAVAGSNSAFLAHRQTPTQSPPINRRLPTRISIPATGATSVLVGAFRGGKGDYRTSPRRVTLGR